MSNRIPHVSDGKGGSGVDIRREKFPGFHGVEEGKRGDRLLPWFYALAERLRRVAVFNRSWESALTPSILGTTKTTKQKPRAIVMDPPYVTTKRVATLYQSDIDNTSDDVAAASHAWAVEHGERDRIVYCCHARDFEFPPGWTPMERAMAGIKKASRRGKAEVLWFSPACLGKEQESFL